MATRYGIAMTRAPESGVPLGRIETPRLVYAVIAVCTAAAAFLRFYQLARPGYLLGLTEYDDGVNFGDALRLVSGVVPYRDFVAVQPPGTTVLMAPVALLAKGTGAAWGLAIARILTAAADTACVALLGLLVRHRGPVAAGIACGIYAVYPDALVAAHTFMLEPWLNLFCLLGALAVFDGDRLAERPGRLAWGGAAFGFAVAVKLWAVVPLAVIGLLLLRRPRRLGLLAAGAAAGLAVPVLPFLVMAPTGLIKDVVVTQYLRADAHHQPSLPRLADLAGLSLFPHLSSRATAVIVLAIAAVAAARLPGRLLGGRPAPGAPGRLRADRRGGGGRHAAVAVRLLDALRCLRRAVHRAGAGPPGRAAAPGRAPPSARAAAGGQRGRGSADRGGGRAPVRRRDPAAGLDHPGCAGGPADPARVLCGHRLLVPDHQRRPVRPGRGGLPGHGGLLRDPAGPDRRAEIRPGAARGYGPVALAVRAASYVWLEWANQGRIAWTPALYAYFTSHFRLLGVVDGSGAHDVPEGGLYVRR